MRRPFSPEAIATGTAICIVVGFFAGDMVAASGWDWRGWLRSLIHRAVATFDQSEIRDYVEFVTVRQGDLVITTGIQYGSSFQRHITYQWCYAGHSGTLLGEPEYRLSLARKIGDGVVEFHPFTPDNLRPFSLSEQRARELAEGYCRFL